MSPQESLHVQRDSDVSPRAVICPGILFVISDGKIMNSKAACKGLLVYDESQQTPGVSLWSVLVSTSGEKSTRVSERKVQLGLCVHRPSS